MCERCMPQRVLKRSPGSTWIKGSKIIPPKVETIIWKWLYTQWLLRKLPSFIDRMSKCLKNFEQVSWTFPTETSADITKLSHIADITSHNTPGWLLISIIFHPSPRPTLYTEISYGVHGPRQRIFKDDLDSKHPWKQPRRALYLAMAGPGTI